MAPQSRRYGLNEIVVTCLVDFYNAIEERLTLFGSGHRKCVEGVFSGGNRPINIDSTTRTYSFNDGFSGRIDDEN